MNSMGEGIWPFSNRNSAIWPCILSKIRDSARNLCFFSENNHIFRRFHHWRWWTCGFVSSSRDFLETFWGIYSDEKKTASISRHVKWVNCFPQDYTYIYMELKLSKVIKNTIEPCSKCAQVLFPHIICSPTRSFLTKGPFLNFRTWLNWKHWITMKNL